MDFQNKPKSQMKDVSDLGINCTECNNAIKDLPFVPNKRQDGTFGNLYCYDCNKKRKPRFSGGGFGR